MSTSNEEDNNEKFLQIKAMQVSYHLFLNKIESK